VGLQKRYAFSELSHSSLVLGAPREHGSLQSVVDVAAYALLDHSRCLVLLCCSLSECVLCVCVCVGCVCVVGVCVWRWCVVGGGVGGVSVFCVTLLLVCLHLFVWCGPVDW